MANIAVKNEHHWHELRAQNIGASEVAALFGVSPYTTRFTLWHQKSGKVARPEFDSERMSWGNILEPVIAAEMAKRQEWTIRKVHRYITHPNITGMAASLDYEILNHPDGVGCLEVKNVSIEAWCKNWVKNEDGTIEAPLHIELQLQHQLSVTGRSWGAFAFLVGGNEGHVVIRKRHESTIQKIEAAVAEFWESIRKGEAPQLEEAADLAVFAKVFEGTGTVQFDNAEFDKAIDLYLIAQKNQKDAKENYEACRLNIASFLDLYSAEVAIGNTHKVSYKLQRKKAYEVKESESRVLRVTELKGKK